MQNYNSVCLAAILMIVSKGGYPEYMSILFLIKNSEIKKIYSPLWFLKIHRMYEEAVDWYLLFLSVSVEFFSSISECAILKLFNKRPFANFTRHKMATGEEHRWEENPSTSKSAFDGETPVWNDVNHDSDVIWHPQSIHRSCFLSLTTKNYRYFERKKSLFIFFYKQVVNLPLV